MNLGRKPATKWRLERIEERLDWLELQVKAIEAKTHLSIDGPYTEAMNAIGMCRPTVTAPVREAVLALLKHLGFEMIYRPSNRERIEFIYNPAKDETKGKKR